MPGPRPPFPWTAWAVHLLTATGAVWALLATLAVVAGEAKMAWLWLGIALVVDGIDGPLARAFHVKERVPLFDGAALDLIVDYLTYVFVPVLFLWRFGLLPEPLTLPLCILVLLSSLHLFAKADMKSGDNYFVGFPAVWNAAILYLWLLTPGTWVNAAAVLALVALTFIPAKFVHPFRVVEFRPLTLAATATWAVTLVVLVAAHPERPVWALALWLAATAWFGGLGLWRSLRRD